MSSQAAERPRPEPQNERELIAMTPRVDELAFDLHSPTDWYIIIGKSAQQASKHAYDTGVTVADAHPSYDPDSDVLLAVQLDDIERKTNNWTDFDDLRRACKHGRIIPYGFPADRLSPVLNGMVERRKNDQPVFKIEVDNNE
jgi:hypothetical protein